MRATKRIIWTSTCTDDVDVQDWKALEALPAVCRQRMGCLGKDSAVGLGDRDMLSSASKFYPKQSLSDTCSRNKSAARTELFGIMGYDLILYRSRFWVRSR